MTIRIQDQRSAEEHRSSRASAMSTKVVSAKADKVVIPFWCVNVPESEWPEECPAFLLNITDRDRDIVSTPDDQYHRPSWEEVQEFIRTNRIYNFKRLPSDIRKYLAFVAKLKEDYGSVVKFIVEKRLQWTDCEPKDADPFNTPGTGDIKILYNDWPYGIDHKIVHLVVWTKFELDEDPASGDLTLQMRKKIDDFVGRTFCTRVPAERVIWFKNWKALKSVHGVEHFHVMLNDPDVDFVREITNGDIPVSKQFQ